MLLKLRKRFMKIGAAALMLAALGSGAGAQELAKDIFGYIKGPTKGNSVAIGSYAKGCLNGAAQLAETGPTWQAMRLSRNRNWGHPELVDFIQDLSVQARQRAGWAGLYVGDMSQPRGGPMRTGHASHQIGLDVDIWMLPPQRLNLTYAERENLSSISVVNGAFTQVNGNWTRGHFEVMKAAASDPRVARIFVTPAAKLAMCAMEKGNRAYLSKIRPWLGHNYHFHVRLTCPADSGTLCENQWPVDPKDDGCAWAKEYMGRYITKTIPIPVDPNAPKPKPSGPLTLARLPQQCAKVVGR